jgi:uncharacterized protein DUF3754
MTNTAVVGIAAERDQFIPVRKADLLDALVEHGPLGTEAERAKFRQVCRILAAIYHYQYFDQLERLRHDYFYFNPELDPHARFDSSALAIAYADLVESFTTVLKGANFVELSHAEVEQAHRERKAMRVKVAVSLDDFRDVRFFRRGHHQETIETREWFGLRKDRHEVTIYDDIVLFAATKPAAEIASQRERKLLARRRIRPGSVLIKYFRNVASTDLNALFPNVRVVMSMLDSLALGVPALAGAIPLLLNLASTVTVLFLVIGFYLGIVAAVEHDELKRAFAAMSGLTALIGFVMRQWLRYQRQSLKYQKELTDNIYFRNVNNNAGIFDYMIGAAEEQECKEAFLAYYFLRTGATAPTQIELERRIESWLQETFAVDIDFEVEDALAKLDRFGLLKRDGERLAVPSPDETLAHLDRVWGDFFPYRPAEAKITIKA